VNVATGGRERIAGAFAASRKSGRRAALMPYLMAGFPDLAASLRAGEALADAGADLIELGVPFSDPLADGPAIQAAGQRALEAGATFELVLDRVAAPLSKRIPVVLMCYANPLLTRGLDAVTARIAATGVAGVIVPDLPAEEGGELREACDREGLALVPLVAPTTPPPAVAAIAAAARGFVYVVSVTGVTGERGELSAALEPVVERVRAAADVPVAVGFGVGTVEQVARVAEIADGVIVGSRLVRAISEAATADDGIEAAARFVADACAALEAQPV
jgi:tryptophan synthase alpha chain